MDKMRRWVRNERGSILLFTTVLVLPLMIIIGGLAMDIAYLGTVDDELQRSMDAASLAGAGNLGFDPSAFTGDNSPVRQAAQTYAISNPYRADVENLAKQITATTFHLNAANVDNLVDGNIVVGIWNGTTGPIGSYSPGFTRRSSAADDPFVNAVKCQYASTIPTSFLRLIPGLNSLFTAAQAIAISGPPATPCSGCCVFPIAPTQCPFETAGNFGSQGCGQPILYVSNSNNNTAAWINPSGTGTPPASDLRAAVTAAAAGGCPDSSLVAGKFVSANNGAITNVISGTGKYPGLADCNHAKGTCSGGYFIDNFNGPTTYTVHDSDGKTVYSGHGWEVIVPVIDTSCPSSGPNPITGNHEILTWSKMVITQVISHGVCAVTNHYPGNPWDSLCSSGLPGSVDGIFGYYECVPFDAPPVPNPAPRAGLATKIKLVK